MEPKCDVGGLLQAQSIARGLDVLHELKITFLDIADSETLLQLRRELPHRNPDFWADPTTVAAADKLAQRVKQTQLPDQEIRRKLIQLEGSLATLASQAIERDDVENKINIDLYFYVVTTARYLFFKAAN